MINQQGTFPTSIEEGKVLLPVQRFSPNVFKSLKVLTVSPVLIAIISILAKYTFGDGGTSGAPKANERTESKRSSAILKR